MKVLVIGGVAAGTKAAAKLKRMDRSAEAAEKFGDGHIAMTARLTMEISGVGYRIYIGGRWGKKYAHSRALERVYLSEEEVLDVIPGHAGSSRWRRHLLRK